MALGQGYAIYAGGSRKTASGWGGVAKNVNAKERFLILSESISEAREYIPDESLNSTPWRLKSDAGNVTVDGTIDLIGRYDGLEMLLFNFFGRDTWAGANMVGTYPLKAYRWEFRMKEEMEGYYFTFAMDKIVSVAEFPTLKVKTLTISGDAGDRVKFSFGVLGDQMITDNSTGLGGIAKTNANTDVQAAVEPTPRVYMMMADAKFRINAQSGSALGASDNFYPSSFSVTLDRNLGGIHQATGMIDEPANEGFAGATGNFSVPTYKDTNEAIETAYLNGTKQKLDIRIISASQIGGASSGKYYYAFNMFFPEVLVTEAQRPVSGPGRIPADFNFEAFKPSGAYATTGPDGMDGNGSLQNGGGVGNGEARTDVGANAVLIEILNRFYTTTGPEDL